MSDSERRLAAARWALAKDKEIDAFKASRDDTVAAVAAQGHTLFPGHGQRAITDAEILAKARLGEANIAIAQEAVDRKMRELGIRADEEARRAALEFEIAKRETLEVLDQIFADEEYAFAKDETERLLLAELDVDTLERLLIQERTAIDLAEEAIRRDAVDDRNRTLPYEVELAEARVVTAREKLAIIDQIKITIDAQKEVLAARRALVPEKERLARAQQSLLDAEAGLIPLEVARAGKLEELAAAITAEVAILREIAAEKIKQALAALASAESDVEIEELQRVIENARHELQLIALAEARMQAAIAKEREEERADASRAESKLRVDLVHEDSDNRMDAAEYRRSARTYVSETINSIRASVEGDVSAKQIETETATTKNRARERERTAEISAATRMTSRLIHTLAQG